MTFLWKYVIMNAKSCLQINSKMKTSHFCSFLLIFLSVTCLAPGEQDTSTEVARAYQTGLQALTRKDDRAALAAFQETVELDVSYAEAHYQLGVLYGRQSRWQPAIHALQTALTQRTHNCIETWQMPIGRSANKRRQSRRINATVP